MTTPVFTTRSSTVYKVAYNHKQSLLEITFRNGSVYRYHGVPPRLWKIFVLYMECEGLAGAFFNEYLKNKFTSEKASNTAAEGE